MDTSTQPTINDTTQYTLMMRIAHNELIYVYYHPAEDNSMVSKQFAIPQGDNRLKHIESIIYDNEILLQKFRRVYIILPSQHFVLIPSEITTTGDNNMYFNAIYNEKEEELIETRLPHTAIELLSGVERNLLSFLQRTFDNPALLHPLSPLIEYFYRRSRLGNQSKLYAHIYKGTVDIVCYNRKGLLLANTFTYCHSNDVAYHILNVWQQLKLDQRTDEVQLAGDINIRREVTPLLRNYILTVVPVIFPSHSHVLGSDAMQIPFDLTALSLCEL